MDLKEIAKDIRGILDERRDEIGLTFEEETHKYTMNDGLGFSRSDWPSVSNSYISNLPDEFGPERGP